MKLFSWFRKIALSEGISFLLLLLVAMPLKYFAGLPIAVTIVGGLHGVLFLSFIVLMYLVKDKFNKDWKWTGKALLASVLPFGTIVMDREWKLEHSKTNNQ